MNNDVLEIYTNATQIRSSLYEVSFDFSLTTPTSGEEGAELRLAARVRMSPEQAMAVHVLLGRHLRAYGEQFREIFLPNEVVMRLSGEETGETA